MKKKMQILSGATGDGNSTVTLEWSGGVPYVVAAGTFGGASVLLQFVWESVRYTIGDAMTAVGISSLNGEELPAGLTLSLAVTGATGTTDIDAWIIT